MNNSYLSGQYGAQFSLGMQSGSPGIDYTSIFNHSLPPPDPRHIMAIPTLKHAVGYSLEDWSPSGKYSDHTYTRSTFKANISEFDMGDTYLPAFESAIIEGGATGVMSVQK